MMTILHTLDHQVLGLYPETSLIVHLHGLLAGALLPCKDSRSVAQSDRLEITGHPKYSVGSCLRQGPDNDRARTFPWTYQRMKIIWNCAQCRDVVTKGERDSSSLCRLVHSEGMKCRLLLPHSASAFLHVPWPAILPLHRKYDLDMASVPQLAPQQPNMIMMKCII